MNDTLTMFDYWATRSNSARMLMGGGVAPGMGLAEKMSSVLLVYKVCLWFRSDVFSGMGGRDSSLVWNMLDTVVCHGYALSVRAGALQR